MNKSDKSFLKQNSTYTVHFKIGKFFTTCMLVLAVFLLQYTAYAAEKPDGVKPTVFNAVQDDYFFPLSGFPDCNIKSSRVYRTSYSGIPAIGYVEYLEGQPYLNGYELLPDPDLNPAELYTELSSQLLESYGEPAVQIEQKAYPEPDNRLQIWFNEESQTRVFLNLTSNTNQKKCYLAFVNYN